MKVKELIGLLNKMNPEFEVEYYAEGGFSAGYIKGAKEEFDGTVSLCVIQTESLGEWMP
ncbi:hypothetical protein [Leptospira alexanderi]|uniref:hypothetical protein n=1 Tax=Leptospira alexanderi TaxID=100053 RepID=UPI00147E4114|nr:hypothetical protein [Leptospira alexanderi]